MPRTDASSRAEVGSSSNSTSGSVCKRPRQGDVLRFAAGEIADVAIGKSGQADAL